MKFDMSAAWSEAMRLIGANRDVVLIIAGVFFFLPYAGFMMIVGDQITAIQAGAGAGDGDPEAAMEALTGFYMSIWWVFVLLVWVPDTFGKLGLLAVLRDRSRPTVGEALKIGLRTLPSYIVARLLFSILMGILFSIPFVIAAAVSGAEL